MAETNLSEVEVLGLTEVVDNDFLYLYFENKRRSGGGEIQSLTREKSVALITFRKPEDAEGVLSKGEHCLHHVPIQVRRPPPWDLRKVALRGLFEDIDEDLLDLYVEAVSGRDAFRILRAINKTSALVSFQEELSEEDFHHLFTRAERKKLCNQTVSVGRVRACTEVLVENITGHVPPELLEMYFESKRSGGGALRSVTMLRSNAAAIVSFCDWNDADRVLCRQHTLQGCQISVSPYYPDVLGSKDIVHNRVMEDHANMTDTKHSQDIGAPADDTDMLSGHRDDEKMIGLSDTEETHEESSEILMATPELPHMRPELPHMRPELPHMRMELPQIRPDMPQMRPEMPQMTQDMQMRQDVPLTTPEMPQLIADMPRITLASSPVHEAEVVMEEAELSFMQKYNHELLAGIDSVMIFPLEDEDKFGFKVIGDGASCKTAVELLQNIVASISCRSVTLEYPWLSHFLLEEEGQRSLRDIEKQHQCIIDTSQVSWNVLDCVYVDPWSFIHDSTDSPVNSLVTEDNLLLQANMEGIKMFASLLKSAEDPEDTPTSDQKTHGEGSEEDLYTDKSLKDEDSVAPEVKDEELEQVFQMSRKEYREQELDEEAQLLLAIQRSMDTQGASTVDFEDDELQRVLEMSRMELQHEDTEEAFQRALEMSFQERRSHDYTQPMSRPQKAPCNDQTCSAATIRVLAVDETSIVVATTALRKAITSRLNVVSLEDTNGGKNMAQILAALEKKHKVKITKSGRELQIQGFLQGPNQCRQEMSEILRALQDRSPAKSEVMDLDVEDVEMIDVPQTSDEYQHVTGPFMKTLEECKLSIEVLQVQRVHNPLLYNQYQLKKVRMVMSDPNKPAERILYHGTTESSAREICHSGFNRSFCGKNATLYGQGVYFGAMSEISTRDHYSPPNAEGKKFVLVSRVLTGEFTLGKENMRIPPLIESSGGGAPRRYDSLVNSLTKPLIFVIFNDTQAYPEYLITCRNRKDK